MVSRMPDMNMRGWLRFGKRILFGFLIFYFLLSAIEAAPKISDFVAHYDVNDIHHERLLDRERF